MSVFHLIIWGIGECLNIGSEYREDNLTSKSKFIHDILTLSYLVGSLEVSRVFPLDD